MYFIKSKFNGVKLLTSFAKLSILFLVIVFSFTGCRSSETKTNQNTTSLVDKENAKAQFLVFTDSLFQSEITTNTINLHYTVASPEALAISDYAVTLGHCSESNRFESLQRYQSYKDSLSGINYDLLDDKDKITYDILMWYFDNELSSKDFSYYNEMLSPTTGIQAQLPVLLAEYIFRNEKDITNYLSLISQLDSLFSEIITYEQEKSAVGLFMADYAADDIVAQCSAFISDTSQHFLLSTFDSRIDNCSFLTDEQKAAYKSVNSQAVTEHVFPAYQNLINGLNALKGTGTNQGGLCNFPKGKDYYSYLVKAATGSDRAIPDLIELSAAQIQADLNTMSALLNSNPSLLENLNNIKVDDLAPEESLEKLKQCITDSFPEVPNTSYEVKYVDSSLEEHLSPAFYLTPPLDDSNDNIIYVNQASCPKGMQRFITLAHEGYPGHLYQNLFSASKDLNKVRSLFSFCGYTEGYATYAEMFSYDYLGLDQSIADILRLSSSVTLGLYATIDLGIHYEGWSITETTAFLIKYGIQDTGTISTIYRSIIEEPANYLKYYIGYLEILKLKEEAETLKGNDFSLIQFHNDLLSIGEAPFTVVAKYLMQ